MDDPNPQPMHPTDVPRRAVALYPPRYGWTKCLAIFAALLTLAFVVAWVAWRHVAEKRLARELAALEARGEPVRTGDLVASPPLPDAENAAYYFKQAIAAIKPGVDSPASSALEYEDYPPFPPEWHRLANGNVAAHGQVFAWERRARPYARADWQIRLDPPLTQNAFAPLNQARHMANLTGDAALQQHLGGDDAAAVELLRDGRHLARGVDQQPLYISHLVAIGIDSIMLHRTFVIGPGLSIAPGGGGDDVPPAALLPSTRPSPRPAGRAQVRALIDELLADAEATEPLRRALVGERAFVLGLIREITRDDRLLRPMFDLDVARWLAAQPPLSRAATQPTWPGVQTAMLQQGPAPPVRPPPRRTKPPTPLHREPVEFPNVFSAAYAPPGLWLVLREDMRTRAERRLAAVALAVQLYRADHGGAWPASLAPLVPDYLPTLPTDPYAADGRPIGYRIVPAGRPDGADRPVVYDVSEDGKDQLATNPNWLTPEPNFGWRSGAADQWRDLTRWVPPAPATQPGNAPQTAPGG